MIAGTALVVGVLGAGVATATTINIDGGVWDYGVSGNFASSGTVWSNYYHGFKCHRSSVNGNFYASSGPTAPGYWSEASAPRSRWGNESFYSWC
ncbi:MAG: lactococcin 972 family bacteriocin [Mycobacteriaceae bacterium]